MNHLLRSLAPVTAKAWELLEEEARRQLETALAARKLVDFAGPHGWEYSATELGRTEPIAGGAGEGVSALRRVVLPVVEHKQAVFVDPGDEPDELIAMAEASGAEIDAIWLTHAHLDHIGGVAGVRRRWPIRSPTSTRASRSTGSSRPVPAAAMPAMPTPSHRT